MKTTTLYQDSTFDKEHSSNALDIIEFYNEATEDYAFWNKDNTMHFGYFSTFKSNLFKRDSMLNEMNRQVLKHMNLNSEKSLLAKLGCCMGSTMCYALKHYKNSAALGITLSDLQRKEGNKLLTAKDETILKENFNSTLPSAAFDSAVAIESFCHWGYSPKSFKKGTVS